MTSKEKELNKVKGKVVNVIDENKAESEREQNELLEKFFFWRRMFATIGRLSLMQVCLGLSGLTLYLNLYIFNTHEDIYFTRLVLVPIGMYCHTPIYSVCKEQEMDLSAFKGSCDVSWGIKWIQSLLLVPNYSSIKKLIKRFDNKRF